MHTSALKTALLATYPISSALPSPCYITQTKFRTTLSTSAPPPFPKPPPQPLPPIHPPKMGCTPSKPTISKSQISRPGTFHPNARPLHYHGQTPSKAPHPQKHSQPMPRKPTPQKHFHQPQPLRHPPSKKQLHGPQKRLPHPIAQKQLPPRPDPPPTKPLPAIPAAPAIPAKHPRHAVRAMNYTPPPPIPAKNPRRKERRPAQGGGPVYIDVKWDKSQGRWMMQRWDGRWVPQVNWVTGR